MTLEEALAASVVEPVNDIFEIDPETRVIAVPVSEKLFGVANDGNSERKHFHCPKVVGDNIDLSTMHLYINYQNANGDKYPYLVEDIRTDGDYITFSWLIGPDVVAYNATVSNGEVTGKAVGTSVVTVTTDDGGYTAQCTVNVAENTVDPSESHTELESLSVDGNCYFDTEILPDQNTNTEAKLYVKSGTTYICGARDDKYKYGYSVTDNFYVVRGSVSSAVKNTAFWEDAWTIKQNGATATFGNNSVTLDNAGNFTLTSPYYIGCMSKNGEAAGAGLKGKIYYAKIYSGSNLVADMIPVKKSDGTLCLYDKVRKKYIYKSGNGTLTE